MLMELVAFIVIVGIAAVGVMFVMSVTTNHSADPLLQKQALAAAEALLEEIELVPFADIDGYQGYTLHGGDPGTPSSVVAPTGYDAAVEVTQDGALGPAGSLISAADARRVRVTVTYSGGNIVMEGYRTRYAPPVLLCTTC